MRRGYLDSERIQKREKKETELARIRFIADLKAVMNTDFGRRFIYALIFQMAGVEAQSFTGDSKTFFNEGRRALGITLITDLQDNMPALYVQMINEKVTKNAEAIQAQEALRLSVVENENAGIATDHNTDDTDESA